MDITNELKRAFSQKTSADEIYRGIQLSQIIRQPYTGWINEMVVDIALRSETPQVAQQLVGQLTEIDWEAIFQQRQEVFDQWIQDEKDEGTALCSRCNGFNDYSDLHLLEFSDGRSRLFCSACIIDAQEKHHRVCIVCSALFYTLESDRFSYYCGLCHRKYRPSFEESRISVHISRAKKMNVDSTLTLKEWIITLSAFNVLCAYCQRTPFTDIDHFIPLSLGGGHTALNCVPACDSCNSKKGYKHPNEVTGIPASDINRVRAYLATR